MVYFIIQTQFLLFLETDSENASYIVTAAMTKVQVR